MIIGMGRREVLTVVGPPALRGTRLLRRWDDLLLRPVSAVFALAALVPCFLDCFFLVRSSSMAVRRSASRNPLGSGSTESHSSGACRAQPPASSVVSARTNYASIQAYYEWAYNLG